MFFKILISLNDKDSIRDTIQKLFRSILALLFISLLSLPSLPLYGQTPLAENLFIVVMDGLRYDESFMIEGGPCPFIRENLVPEGTIFTGFYNMNETNTLTCHYTIVTGRKEWVTQSPFYEGKQLYRPFYPTIFEEFRRYSGRTQNSCYVFANTNLFCSINYSFHHAFGEESGAKTSLWVKDYDIPDTELFDII